jgi:hypothetical protein
VFSSRNFLALTIVVLSLSISVRSWTN